MKAKLNIWLIKEGEPLPIDTSDQRLSRTGNLAKYLADSGHQVVWWSSGYIHAKKQYIFKEHKEIHLNDNELLVLLHSNISYKRNISISRFLYFKKCAREFRKHAETKMVPDIIICSYPSIDFAEEAIRYGKKYGVPVILDARDQWPDIFVRAFPENLRLVSKLFLSPMKRKARSIFSSANAISAMSPPMLQWALKYADRERKETDKVIFIGSERKQTNYTLLKDDIDFWGKLGITSETWNICLFTSLSPSTQDIDTLINAVDILYKKYNNIRLIIGGKGDDEKRLKHLAKNMPAVFLMGWLDKKKMESLMSMSKVGMLSVHNTKDFRDAWGNKVGQYFSYGLPVLTSAEGYAKEYLEKNQCGLYYQEGDVSNLIQKLDFLISCENERQILSKNAQDMFKVDFDYSVVCEKFEKLIYEVMICFASGESFDKVYNTHGNKVETRD